MAGKRAGEDMRQGVEGGEVEGQGMWLGRGLGSTQGDVRGVVGGNGPRGGWRAVRGFQ